MTKRIRFGTGIDISSSYVSGSVMETIDKDRDNDKLALIEPCRTTNRDRLQQTTVTITTEIDGCEILPKPLWVINADRVGVLMIRLPCTPDEILDMDEDVIEELFDGWICPVISSEYSRGGSVRFSLWHGCG